MKQEVKQIKSNADFVLKTVEEVLAKNSIIENGKELAVIEELRAALANVKQMVEEIKKNSESL